jgi:hypothetical protein
MGSLEITLVAADGTRICTTEEEIADWGTMKDLIADAGADNPIPLERVDSATLARLVEFARDKAEGESDVEKARRRFGDWDAQIDGIKAANYLAFPRAMDAIGMLLVEPINAATTEEEMKKLIFTE